MGAKDKKKGRRISAPVPNSTRLVSSASPYNHLTGTWNDPTQTSVQDALVDQTRALALTTPRPGSPFPTKSFPRRKSSLSAKKSLLPSPLSTIESLDEETTDGEQFCSTKLKPISSPVTSSFEHRNFLTAESANGYLDTLKTFESAAASTSAISTQLTHDPDERSPLSRKRPRYLKIPSQATVKEGILRKLSLSRGRKRPAPVDEVEMEENDNDVVMADAEQMALRKIHYLPKSKSISSIAYEKARDNIHQAWNNACAVMKINRGAKVPKNQRLFFHGEEGSTQFHDKILDPTFDPKTVGSLHIVLNYNDWSLDQDDFYSMGLGFFAGTDHKLKELSITVLGNTLFTQETHMIAAGTMRAQHMKQEMGVSTKYSYWRKIADGTATRQTFQDCKPTVSISVKSIVKAICAIKNVPSIVVQGAIETELKVMIEKECGCAKDGGMLPPIPRHSELFKDMHWMLEDPAALPKTKEPSQFSFKNTAAYNSTTNLLSTTFGGKSRTRKDAAQIASDAKLAAALANEDAEQRKMFGFKKPQNSGTLSKTKEHEDPDAITAIKDDPMMGSRNTLTNTNNLSYHTQPANTNTQPNKLSYDMTPANSLLYTKPATVSDSLLPFAQDRQGKYNLRSRAGSLNNGKLSDVSSSRRPSIASSNKRRKANDQKLMAEHFANSRVENIVIDTSASPPLKPGLMEECVRVSAHRCEPPWDTNKDKYITGAEQLENGCIGNVILGWKVIYMPKTKTWVVGREDELGSTSTVL